METRVLIEQLRRPGAYPHPPDDFRLHQTHISVVFLAGPWAYKVKKPLDLGFLDFTTLERRRHFCQEEVRLNRRLAPDVYLGVVPVTGGPEGLRFEGEGEAVEWAVKMRRLPPEATLLEELHREALDEETLVVLARRLATFHRQADGGPAIARYGRYEIVAGNARENLAEARSQVGRTLSPEVHRRLVDALDRRLSELEPLVEARALRHVPRDTHGDLHLDHVYLFPDQPSPGDLVIIDCIEFNERFRHADPVSDMAFLAMDLIHHGRRELEEAFSEAWFRASGDEEGRTLLPFYRSYRAAVRGKVRGMVTGDEVPAGEREAARLDSRGHWLLALSELEPPDRRPGLVLVIGLPGTGKSTVARGVAREGGFRLLSSDRTRKSLAGVGEEAAAAADFGEGIYTSDWSDLTYDALLAKVEEALFLGERVLVDANFREEERRRRFLEAARAHGVRALVLECRASPETVRERLAGRSGGPSDADWKVHREAARRWEEPSRETRRALAVLSSEGPPDTVVSRALDHLREAGLREESR
jgi:uncharacterized protein